MITDSLESIIDSIKDRIRNPILGAYLISFISFNWELVYTLFNFENDCTRLERVKVISDYLSAINKWEMFLCPLGFAFLSILFFNVANILSGFIFDFFRNKVKNWPWMKKQTSFEGLINSSDYNILHRKYESLKSENNNLTTSITILNSEIESKQKGNIELAKKLNELTIQVESKVKDINNLENQNNLIRNSGILSLPNIKAGPVFKDHTPLKIFQDSSKLWSLTRINPLDGTFEVEKFNIDDNNRYNLEYVPEIKLIVKNIRIAGTLLYFEKIKGENDELDAEIIYKDFLFKISETEFVGFELISKRFQTEWYKVEYKQDGGMILHY